MIRRLLWSALFASGFALWAVGVNAEHGFSKAMLAGVVQYLSSAAASFVMYSGAEWAGRRSWGPAPSWLAATLLPSVAVVGAMLAAHAMIGTPDPFQSVALSAVIAPIGCFWWFRKTCAPPPASGRSRIAA